MRQRLKEAQVGGRFGRKAGGINLRKGWIAEVTVDDDAELAALWRAVDVLPGYRPNAEWIARLVAFAAGQISAADYLTHVTQTAPHRQC